MTDDDALTTPPEEPSAAEATPDAVGPAAPAPIPAPLTLHRLADRIGRIHSGLEQPAHGLLGQVEALDTAVYRAVATSPTPDLDRMLQRLSDSANYSKLWFGIAGGLALFGGRRGRRAAVEGVIAIGVASLLANQVVKPVVVRGRPTREDDQVVDRVVRMPASRSFPSGHTASAFAFTAAVSNVIPPLSFPLSLVATAVGYSRVHTGVHFPADVLFGSVLGAASGETTSWAMAHLQRRRLLDVTSVG